MYHNIFFHLQLIDWRIEFSKWWVTEFKTVKIPSEGSVFNYFIDSETHKFVPWTERLTPFEMDLDVPLQVSFISWYLRNIIVVYT